MLTYKGKPFNSDSFMSDMEKEIVRMAKEEMAQRFRAIRHPKSGEFPTVVIYGDDFKDMWMRIEASNELIKHIRERALDDNLEVVDFVEKEKTMAPKVFLSFAFENHSIAESIANQLMENGVNTWWAEWELKAGDSLRQRIDLGLGSCTHFIVLLTPQSIKKPWVKQEMDAGLVRMLSDKCRFIPLRYDLSADDLPELLSGQYSPEISDDHNISQLINDIYGISNKPKLGKSPSQISLPDTGYSKAASIVAKVFCEETEHATFLDPQLSLEDMIEKTELTQDDLRDAIFELRAFVKEEFGRITANDELYVEFDKNFMEWDPEKDALRMASDFYNGNDFPSSIPEIAEKYGWHARRMNPAVSYLVARQIVAEDMAMGSHPWIMHSLREEDEGTVRRFVKSRSLT